MICFWMRFGPLSELVTAVSEVEQSFGPWCELVIAVFEVEQSFGPLCELVIAVFEEEQSVGPLCELVIAVSEVEQSCDSIIAIASYCLLKIVKWIYKKKLFYIHNFLHGNYSSFLIRI